MIPPGPRGPRGPGARNGRGNGIGDSLPPGRELELFGENSIEEIVPMMVVAAEVLVQGPGTFFQRVIDTAPNLVMASGSVANNWPMQALSAHTQISFMQNFMQLGMVMIICITIVATVALAIRKYKYQDTSDAERYRIQQQSENSKNQIKQISKLFR